MVKPVGTWLISALGFAVLAVAMFVTDKTMLAAAFAFLTVSMIAGAVGSRASGGKRADGASRGKEPLG